MARPLRLLTLAVILILLASGATSASATARDVVLLLDNSGSMRQNDPQFLMPRAVTEFLQGLTERTRVALVAFDQKVHLAAPFTPVTETNRRRLLEKLAIIDYRGRFTNSPAGMERAIYELKRHGRADGEKVVIFVTDGIVDTGDPARDRELAKWMRETLAGEAATAGIRIFGIAFTEAADFQLIQTVTFKTGGRYFRAADAEDMATVFDRIYASLQYAEAPRAQSDSSAMSRPRLAKPSTDAALASRDPSLTVLGEPSSAAPPVDVEMLETERIESPPSIKQQPTIQEKAQAAKLERDSAALPFSTSLGDALTSKPATEAKRSAYSGISTPILLVILGCGLMAMLAAIFAILLWRRHHRPCGEPVPPVSAPNTTRYPPPFCLLKDLSGATQRETHDITGRLTRISRVAAEDSPSVRTLVINDDYISREHAIIEYRDYGYWLIDRGSVNGSFVNDQRITSERLLKHADRLRFHTYEFEVVLPEMEGAAETRLARVPSAEGCAAVPEEKPTALVAAGQRPSTEANSDNEANTPQADARI